MWAQGVGGANRTSRGGKAMRLDQPSRIGRLLTATAMALLVAVGCQALPHVTTDLRISVEPGFPAPDLQPLLSATPYPASERHLSPVGLQYRSNQCAKGGEQRSVTWKKTRKLQVGRHTSQERGC
jgi:hypothetical protein